MELSNSQTLQFAADLIEGQLEEINRQLDGMSAGVKMLEQTQHALRSTLSVIQPRIEELRAGEPEQLTFDLVEEEETNG
jgi:prefoldin subunit 5